MTKNTHVKVCLACVAPLVSINNFTLIFLSVAAATLPDYDLKLKIKHRTITHCILFYIVIGALLYRVNFETFIFFSIGYLSHLLLDSLTKHGIPLFYPFSKKTYGLKLFKTGEKFDKFVGFFSKWCIIIYVMYILYDFCSNLFMYM